jgi:hypothetical protein
MRTLEKQRGGWPSPTGTAYFLSTYRRRYFRLSRALWRDLGEPATVCIAVAKERTYFTPCDHGVKIDRDGKFTSKALHDWLGKPEAGSHYPVTIVEKAGKIARIDRRKKESPRV